MLRQLGKQHFQSWMHHPLVEELLKRTNAVNLKEKLTPEVNPIEAQEQVLKYLLETAKDTQFGKAYQFETLIESETKAEDFAATIPYFDYNKISEEWWNKLHNGEDNVT